MTRFGWATVLAIAGVLIVGGMAEAQGSADVSTGGAVTQDGTMTAAQRAGCVWSSMKLELVRAVALVHASRCASAVERGDCGVAGSSRMARLSTMEQKVEAGGEVSIDHLVRRDGPRATESELVQTVARPADAQ